MRLISTVFTSTGDAQPVAQGPAWTSVVMSVVLLVFVVLLLRFAARIGSRALFPDSTETRD